MEFRRSHTKTDHSSPSSEGSKKEWSCTSTSLCTFVLCRGAALSFCLRILPCTVLMKLLYNFINSIKTPLRPQY